MSFEDFEFAMKKFPFLKKLLLEYQDKDITNCGLNQIRFPTLTGTP